MSNYKFNHVEEYKSGNYGIPMIRFEKIEMEGDYQGVMSQSHVHCEASIDKAFKDAGYRIDIHYLDSVSITTMMGRFIDVAREFARETDDMMESDYLAGDVEYHSYMVSLEYPDSLSKFYDNTIIRPDEDGKGMTATTAFHCKLSEVGQLF